MTNAIMETNIHPSVMKLDTTYPFICDLTLEVLVNEPVSFPRPVCRWQSAKKINKKSTKIYQHDSYSFD